MQVCNLRPTSTWWWRFWFLLSWSSFRKAFCDFQVLGLLWFWSPELFLAVYSLEIISFWIRTARFYWPAVSGNCGKEDLGGDTGNNFLGPTNSKRKGTSNQKTGQFTLGISEPGEWSGTEAPQTCFKQTSLFFLSSDIAVTVRILKIHPCRPYGKRFIPDIGDSVTPASCFLVAMWTDFFISTLPINSKTHERRGYMVLSISLYPTLQTPLWYPVCVWIFIRE